MDTAPTPDNLPALTDAPGVTVRPVKGGRGRMDVEVATPTPTHAIESTDLVAHLRKFFDALDAEVDAHAYDPVALAQALARLEAILADVRYVRDRVKGLCADALDAHRVRRLTVMEVTTVEASSETKRTDWDHERLTRDLVAQAWEAGQINHPNDVADLLLECARPEWRLTPLRDRGFDPDTYCTVAQDQDGRTVRTPTVRIVDNLARRSRA